MSTSTRFLRIRYREPGAPWGLFLGLRSTVTVSPDPSERGSEFTVDEGVHLPPTLRGDMLRAIEEVRTHGWPQACIHWHIHDLDWLPTDYGDVAPVLALVELLKPLLGKPLQQPMVSFNAALNTYVLGWS